MPSKVIPFDFNRITKNNAWLLGFIFADATVGIQQGTRVIKLYNKDKNLLERIKLTYELPYKVTKQKNKNNIVYFLRLSDQKFIKSVEFYGFSLDKSELHIPEMTKISTREFLKGFLIGKGSFFEEKKTSIYGFKVVYRSEFFIQEIARIISLYCNVPIAKPHCRKITHHTSCQIKYVNSACDRILNFLNS